MRKFMKHWSSSIVIAVVLTLFLNTYVARAMKVPTESMEPTIKVNDRLVVNKLFGDKNLERGDIVVFYPPVAAERHIPYVKRLVGMPGDTVEIQGGVLLLNGDPVDEPYLAEKPAYLFGPVTVPEGHYLFLGDNRNVSFDAHLWPTPFVPAEDVIGKVVLEIPTHVLGF